MPYMRRDKEASTTEHAPRLLRCDGMDTSQHALAVVRRCQLVSLPIWLSGNAVSSKDCSEFFFALFSRLGISYSLTRFDDGLFRDHDNFRGRPREHITAA